MANNKIFSDFVEYWGYARSLSHKQRTIIFSSLSEEQQRKLGESYKRGAWEDVFSRNSINNKLDEVKDEFGYDLIEIRSRVLSGRSFILPMKDWEDIADKFKEYSPRHLFFIFGGIQMIADDKNRDIAILDKIR